MTARQGLLRISELASDGHQLEPAERPAEQRHALEPDLRRRRSLGDDAERHDVYASPSVVLSVHLCS